MARVRLDPRTRITERALTTTGKTPSLADSVTVYQTPDGRLIARLRVDSGGGRYSLGRWLVWEWLRYSAWLYKIQAPYVVEQYRGMSRGLWLQPRDIFTAALRGRLWLFERPDGVRIWPWIVRRDMSTVLDSLIQTPGGILYRDVDMWKGLPGGMPGYVLTMSEASLPVWSPLPDTVSGVRRFVFDGWMLQGTGQGSGAQTLLQNRRAINMTGVALSSIGLTFELPLDGGVVQVSVYGRNTGTTGGAYRFRRSFYTWGDSSNLLDTSTETWTHSGLGPGQEGRIDLPVMSVGSSVTRRFVSLQFERLGAASEDTNNENLAVWLVTVNIGSPS